MSFRGMTASPARRGGSPSRTRRRRPPTSVEADHHVGRLDHRVSLLPPLQFEFVDRFVGDRRGHYRAASQIDAHVRGRRSLDDIDDRSVKLVAGADFHALCTPWNLLVTLNRAMYHSIYRGASPVGGKISSHPGVS